MSVDPPTDADRLASIKRGSTIGVAANLGAQLIRMAATFAFQIAMARLLSPEAFGLVALGGPVIALAQLAADLGLAQATIQRPDLSQAELSSMFWLNALMNVALAAIVAASAPLVSAFYGNGELTPVLLISSMVLFLNGVSAIHVALLNRGMRFVRLASADTGSLLVGYAVGIVAALAGIGVWSILASQVVTALMLAILVWPLTGWRPDATPRPVVSRAIFGFGLDLTTFNLVNYFARNVDKVLIGRVYGEASLGVYDRAYRLLLMPLTQVFMPLGRVAIPMLSRLVGDPASYRRAFLMLVTAANVIAYPVVVFAIATSDTLIEVLLGPKWSGTAPIFQVLSVGGIAAPISVALGWLYVSQGRTRELRNSGIVNSAGFVLAFVVGLAWGPIGVAAGYVLTLLVVTPFICVAVTRSGPVGLRPLLLVVLPCLVAALATLAADLAIMRIAPANGWTLIGLFPLDYALFLVVLWIVPSTRDYLSALVRQATGPLSRLALGRGRT